MRHAIVVITLMAGCSALLDARQGGAVDLRAMLDQYLRGDRDGAVAKAAAIQDLGPLRLRFVQDTPGWIAADPAHREGRGAVVAAFLLELTAARLESDWGRLSDLIEWTCVQLRAAGPPTEFERSWHAASHALAGRARARLWLLGPYAVLPHQKPSNAPPPKNQPPPVRHLMHALERFPDDPQFQLSRIVAWTWGRDTERTRNVRRREDRDEPTRFARSPSQMQAIVALEPLMAIPEVAAEAHMRAGMIQLTVSDHAAALRAFEAAMPIAKETAVKYIALLNAGRALEALGRPEEAERQYQRALELVPEAESATVALTSLQFMRDDREAAVAQIDRVFNRLPSPPDPGRLSGYGSFLRWPALHAAMRRAVPQ